METVCKQTAAVGIGQALCVASMLGVFALLGYGGQSILLGGMIGGVLGVLNFFFMAVSANWAADKARSQDVRGGQAVMRLSYLVRMVLLFAVLFALARSGICNIFCAALPLLFTRPILTVGESIRKAGARKL